jgi:hypothetical protein
VSVALNAKHAEHVNGGVAALLLFAAPTVALLIVADLAWAATRARRRAAEGDRPVTLPRYGMWGWLLAGEQAWKATRDRAVAHVTSTDPIRTGSGPRPDRSATAALREHFAGMDPAEAIRLAHSAKPATPPAELAAELGSYGVHVSAVQVALVLGYQPPQVRIERPDPAGLVQPPMPLTSPDPNPDRSGPRPTTVIAATQMVASRGITDEEAATEEVSRLLGRPVKRETVRRYLDGRVKPPATRQDDPSGPMKGGYA